MPLSESLVEEFEVLESIYPTELTKISDTVVQLECEPEEDNSLEGTETIKVTFRVEYGPSYPDAIPDLSLHTVEEGGELDDDELAQLLDDLKGVAEENIGIAMTFTLVSHLRERLASLVKDRAEKVRKAEMEKERLAMEAEEARTRGTIVTPERFREWKTKFDQEQAVAKKIADEERMRGLTPKEREEFRRATTRLTGRQLFERNTNLDEDSLMEEGTVSVDVSQYDRATRNDEPEEDEGLTFSDSD
ncbi:RWD-domain-containing protein [Mycena kentingensis (nom. inval.)]|nr:RWD-domain-containing protein [Mycena kentingensis (nom. inval.)]